MDFGFTEEQKMMQETIRKLVEREYPPEKVREDDANGTFPMEFYRKLAQAGFVGAPFPEAYGGTGGGVVEECLIIEELARFGASVALSYFMTVCFGGKTLEFFGNEDQKQKYLTKICSGELIVALGLTEPDGGTDVLGAMKTNFKKEGDHYLLNGQKMFISGVPFADYIMVVGRTSGVTKKKSEGISVFMVDRKSPGIEFQELEKMGIKAAPTTVLYFDDVVVPAENMLGTEGQGWYGIVKTLNNERTIVGALCTGLAQGALNLAVDYVKERTAFNRPIGQFQAIQHYLAEIATEVDAARMLTYKAAWLQEQGLRNDIASAKAKLYASEVAVKAAQVGIRVMGGAGYLIEHDMERFYRDVALFMFAPVSNEMCKNYIGETELGLPRSF